MKLGSTLLTFGFTFDIFKRWLQNFGFIHTDSKFWSSELGNGESSKSQYRSYLEAGKGHISIASVFTYKNAANIFSIINPEDSMFFNFFTEEIFNECTLDQSKLHSFFALKVIKHKKKRENAFWTNWKKNQK